MADMRKKSEMNVEIVKKIPGNTPEEDHATERIPCKAPNKEQLKKSRFSLPKPTMFDLYNLFIQNVPCANIEGTLHILDLSKGYYTPVTQRGLEEILLEKFYSEVVASGSTNIVKKCAELIMRKMPPEVTPPNKDKILYLNNGYLPLDNLEITSLQAYSTVNVYPTYKINANGYTDMHNWGRAKALEITGMDAFLNSIAGNDPAIVARIWQMIGYLLTPDTNGKCFFLLQGAPNSGKSVLGNLMKALVSNHRIASLDIDQLGKKNATSLLVNKSINISMDLPNKALLPLAIRNIKLITGNDDLTVEFANGTYATYRGGCKFLFATNHAITLKGADLGFEERIVRIPFANTIPASQRDRNLLANLINEKDRIVTKAIAHYRDLRNNNYIFSGSELDICKTKIRYLPVEAEDMDAALCQFVDDRCVFKSHDYGTYTEDLHDAYLTYCQEYGYTPIDNRIVFSRRFYKCYGDRVKKDKWRSEDWNSSGTDLESKNQNGFLGIVLKDSLPQMINGVWNV